MLKNILLFLVAVISVPTICFADDFVEDDYDGYQESEDFEDDFSIMPSENMDITATDVSINSDASAVKVSGFDIAGIMLGMSFDEVYSLFNNNMGLYRPRKQNSVVYTIHPDWKYNLDYECRQQNIFMPEKLDNCIKTMARGRGLLYASEFHLVRESTGETITVRFTSNATDNVVYSVEYNNDVNVVEGIGEKFTHQREKKILAFWQSVLDKYGAPNSGTDKWISSNNAYDPMMTAYYGRLELIDRGRMSTDQAKNVQQSRKHFKAKPYAF